MVSDIHQILQEAIKAHQKGNLHDAVGASGSRINRLGEIKAPTLVIHGTEDPILPLDHGMALADKIPGAKKLIMEGVGHEMPEALMPEIINEMLALFRATETQKTD